MESRFTSPIMNRKRDPTQRRTISFRPNDHGNEARGGRDAAPRVGADCSRGTSRYGCRRGNFSSSSHRERGISSRSAAALLTDYSSMLGQDAASAEEQQKSAGLSIAELAALKDKPFDSAAAAAGLPSDCPVCLTGFSEGQKIKLLPCSHAFCAPCTNRWFHSHTTCPMCRLDCRFVNGFAPYVAPERRSRARMESSAVAAMPPARTTSRAASPGPAAGSAEREPAPSDRMIADRLAEIAAQADARAEARGESTSEVAQATSRAHARSLARLEARAAIEQQQQQQQQQQQHESAGPRQQPAAEGAPAASTWPARRSITGSSTGHPVAPRPVARPAPLSLPQEDTIEAEAEEEAGEEVGEEETAERPCRPSRELRAEMPISDDENSDRSNLVTAQSLEAATPRVGNPAGADSAAHHSVVAHAVADVVFPMSEVAAAVAASVGSAAAAVARTAASPSPPRSTTRQLSSHSSYSSTPRPHQSRSRPLAPSPSDRLPLSPMLTATSIPSPPTAPTPPRSPRSPRSPPSPRINPSVRSSVPGNGRNALSPPTHGPTPPSPPLPPSPNPPTPNPQLPPPLPTRTPSRWLRRQARRRRCARTMAGGTMVGGALRVAHAPAPRTAPTFYHRRSSAAVAPTSPPATLARRRPARRCQRARAWAPPYVTVRSSTPRQVGRTLRSHPPRRGRTWQPTTPRAPSRPPSHAHAAKRMRLCPLAACTGASPAVGARARTPTSPQIMASATGPPALQPRSGGVTLPSPGGSIGARAAARGNVPGMSRPTTGGHVRGAEYYHLFS